MSKVEYRDNPGKCDFCKVDDEIPEDWEEDAGYPYILQIEKPGEDAEMVWACTIHAELLDNVLKKAGDDR